MRNKGNEGETKRGIPVSKENNRVLEVLLDLHKVLTYNRALGQYLTMTL